MGLRVREGQTETEKREKDDNRERKIKGLVTWVVCCVRVVVYRVKAAVLLCCAVAYDVTVACVLPREYCIALVPVRCVKTSLCCVLAVLRWGL